MSNVRMNELSAALDQVQSSTEEYLNTKSSEAMEDYYRSEQEFRRQIEELNTRVTDDEMLLTEKNIRGLSENYLSLMADIIQAKRGRNVERYGFLYEEACVLYDEIHTFIYSLNNEQFKNNSATYQILMNSLRYTEMVTFGVLLVVFLGNISLIVISTRMVTQPLHRLAQSADEVARGNFEIEKIPLQSMDEVGVVTGAFNQMVESIRNYIEQLRETLERENQLKERELMMQSHLKDAQLKYLQAQINPHFLFNTLNAGAQLAMMEDAGRTGIPGKCGGIFPVQCAQARPGRVPGGRDCSGGQLRLHLKCTFLRGYSFYQRCGRDSGGRESSQYDPSAAGGKRGQLWNPGTGQGRQDRAVGVSKGRPDLHLYLG